MKILVTLFISSMFVGCASISADKSYDYDFENQKPSETQFSGRYR